MIKDTKMEIAKTIRVYSGWDIGEKECLKIADQIYKDFFCDKVAPAPAEVDIRQQGHYTQFKIQPVVFIAENNLDFLTGNVIKYVLRHGKKNGVEDLEKAKHYLDMLIQKVKGEKIIP